MKKLINSIGRKDRIKKVKRIIVRTAVSIAASFGIIFGVLLTQPEASVMGTNTPNIGIQQIQLYPGVYDSDTGNVDYYYPSVSPIYTNGTDILHLQVDQTTEDIFTYNNCNCWVFRILYCSDSNVTSIDFRFNNKVFTTIHSTESSVATFIIPNTPYFTYDVVYHFKSGATPTCGGHVNIWQ